ncbi:MAG: membrane-associated HD superfamily phosphohydrolase, partial [Patescibacteria group bacterium]
MINNTLSNNIKSLPNIARYVLLLFVVFLISLLFPNNARFPYAIEKGHRWNYEDIYAPIDFGIKKSEEDLTEERMMIESQVPSYYELNPHIVREKKQEFRSAFDAQLTQVQTDGQYVDVTRRAERYIQFSERFIENVYTKGIIQLSELDVVKGDKFVVQLRQGNTTSKRTIQSFMKGGKAAENWMPDSLFVSRLSEADFLIPLFENFFTPNVFYNDTLTGKFKDEQLNLIVPTRGKIEKGELIIAREDIVTEELSQVLLSFQEQYEQDVSVDRSWLVVYIGYLLLTGLIALVFLLYLQIHANYVFKKLQSVLFMAMWLLVYSYCVYVVEHSEHL